MSTRTPSAKTPDLDASLEQMRGIADDAVGRLRETATSTADVLAERAPAATGLSQQAIADVAERLDRSPEDALMLGAALTGGIWIGMVLARAPRWLMLVALVPTVIVLLAALPRFATPRRAPKGR